MTQELQKSEKIIESLLKVNDTTDIKEIETAFDNLLFVPDISVKPFVIETYLEYIQSKLQIPDYKLKVFIAYYDGKPFGIVLSDLSPEYKSYGRKCGTFGWLYVKNFDTCKHLLRNCELFIKEHKFRKMRGPFNYPKNKMGFGLQVEGFNEQLLYGVGFDDPFSELSTYLERLGYIPESEYTCLRVDEESWKRGNYLDNSLKLCCVTQDELLEKVDDIIDLAISSFSSLLPDTSGGGRENLLEVIKLAINAPKSHFRFHDPRDMFKKYSHIPEFIEAWEEADLENMVTMFPMAIERRTGKLIGLLIGLYDYYQYWRGEYITRINVHTAMVRKGYNGKGVFSSLNNFGQATNRSMRSLTYYEGTAVWTGNSKGVNNQKAVNSIFPHCTPIRKHIVYEKRIR
ncbi:MAG: hypothetical protein ACFFB0_08515 [Promethearchaeota archaeon]